MTKSLCVFALTLGLTVGNAAFAESPHSCEALFRPTPKFEKSPLSARVPTVKLLTRGIPVFAEASVRPSDRLDTQLWNKASEQGRELALWKMYDKAGQIIGYSNFAVGTDRAVSSHEVIEAFNGMLEKHNRPVTQIGAFTLVQVHLDTARDLIWRFSHGERKFARTMNELLRDSVSPHPPVRFEMELLYPKWTAETWSDRFIGTIDTFMVRKIGYVVPRRYQP